MYLQENYHLCMHLSFQTKGELLPCCIVSFSPKQPFHQRRTRMKEMENITARTIPTIAPADRLFRCSEGGGESGESGVKRKLYQHAKRDVTTSLFFKLKQNQNGTY